MDNSNTNLSGWPLVWSWGGNAVSWFIGPSMSPLQVFALLLTVSYTAYKFWLLWQSKRPIE